MTVVPIFDGQARLHFVCSLQIQHHEKAGPDTEALLMTCLMHKEEAHGGPLLNLASDALLSNLRTFITQHMASSMPEACPRQACSSASPMNHKV